MYRCCTTTGRLETVEHGTHTATYGYKANTNLLASTTYTASALTITRNWDNLNRLGSITNAPSATSPADMSFTYSYNDLNQRTEKELESGDKWVYDYDSFGQVTSAHKEDSTEALWPGYDFGYTFDDIGNRKTAVQNGETATYTPTLLNQYTQRTIPGVTQIRGQADSAAVVTVNTESVTRKDDYFFKKLTVDNSTDSVWESVTVRGVLAEAGRDDTDAVAEEEFGRWVPETPEAFNYDDDGNLTQDGRWDYTWNGDGARQRGDGEARLSGASPQDSFGRVPSGRTKLQNRLVAMETRAVAYTAGAPRERLEFIYDSQGRRVQKTHLVWDDIETAFVEKSRDLFLYDGWNLLAELRAIGGAAEAEMHRRYAWGMDLSGTLQGAGGVGGLVMVILADETVLYPSYDGNGNVMGLFDPDASDWAAEYEYGAFGERLRATGPLADANPFRFSTKYTDAETDLIYYGFRYYVPETGRWLNRDPIGEEGGLNLYGMVGNNPIDYWDYLGLVDLGPWTRDVLNIRMPFYSFRISATIQASFEYDDTVSQADCPNEWPFDDSVDWVFDHGWLDGPDVIAGYYATAGFVGDNLNATANVRAGVGTSGDRWWSRLWNARSFTEGKPNFEASGQAWIDQQVTIQGETLGPCGCVTASASLEFETEATFHGGRVVTAVSVAGAAYITAKGWAIITAGAAIGQLVTQ